MRQELVAIQHELGKGGALCKEFNRVRKTDSLTWRVEMFYALGLVEKNKGLAKAAEENPDSLGRCIIDAGVLGLSLSPAKKEAYLIPYRIKVGPNRWQEEVTLSISYMGMEQIAYATGFVDLIQTVLVREGDIFEMWSDENGRHVRHQETSDDGKVTHAYTIIKLSSGQTYIEKMTRREIDACKKAATDKNGGVIPFTWKGEFRGEMYKKSVFRRAWKHVPRSDSPQLSRMLEAVERTDPMAFQEDATVVTESPYVDGDMLDELTAAMSEAGVNSKHQSAWLQGLAASIGYPQGIKHLLKTDFQKAKDGLEEAIERWKEKVSQASKESDSEPDATTAPEEEK